MLPAPELPIPGRGAFCAGLVLLWQHQSRTDAPVPPPGPEPGELTGLTELAI